MQAFCHGMRSAVLAVAGLLSLSGCAGGATEEASEAPCTPGITQPADIRTMIAHPREWMGKCVTIRGAAVRYRIYADVDAFYQPASEWDAESSNGGVLGLEGAGLNDDSDWYADGQQELTGTMHDCRLGHEAAAAMMTANPDTIVMLGGYCHTSNGLYFIIESGRRTGPVTLERQLLAKAGARYGDIELAPQGWALQKMVQDKADEYLSAVRAGDGTRLRALHLDFDYADGEPDEMIDLLVRDPRSVFARLRKGPDKPQAQMFVARLSSKDRRELGAGVDMLKPIVCFCLTGDCRKLWPIRRRDADNLPSRPYACFRLEESAHDGRTTIMLKTPRGTVGLVEPKR